MKYVSFLLRSAANTPPTLKGSGKTQSTWKLESGSPLKLLFGFSLVLTFSVPSFGGYGIYETYVQVNIAGATSTYVGEAGSGTSFDGADLGAIRRDGTFQLKGGEVKSWKNDGGDVYGAGLQYRVYADGGTPGDFIFINLPWAANNVDGGSGNQSWNTYTQNINLLDQLDEGNYILEVYWEIWGNDVNQYDNNSSSNYKANFSVYKDYVLAASADVTAASWYINGAGTATATPTLAATSRLNIPSGFTLTIDEATTCGHIEVEPGGVVIPSSNLGFDSMTLNSDATGTAAVGQVNGTVSGTITFERYVPDNTNDATSFVNLSSYVSGINVSNWTGAGANYVFEYDESNPGGLNDGWGPTTGELEVGKGYMAQFQGTSGFTLTYTGALTSGDKNVTVTRTPSNNENSDNNEGWNLVGNPYPCPVSFSSLNWSGTAPGGFYVWNEDEGGYSVEALTGTIGVGQSFWIQVGATQTLTFTEGAKTTASSPFIRSASDPLVFGVRASEPNGKSTRALRMLDLNATPNYDASYDLRTLGDPVEEDRVMVWFNTMDSVDVSILATHPTDGSIVPLLVKAGMEGTTMFELDEAYGAPEGLCVTLTDTYTGEVYDLTSGADVVVTLEAETVYHDRFLLGTAALPTPVVTSTWCAQGVVDYGVDAASWNVVWQDASTGATLENVEADGVVPGTYNVAWSQEGLCAGSTEVVVNAPCMGDFDGNGTRGSGDLLQLVAFLNLQDGAATLTHDCDCDGALGVQDILTFLSAFGTTCETE